MTKKLVKIRVFCQRLKTLLQRRIRLGEFRRSLVGKRLSFNRNSGLPGARRRTLRPRRFCLATLHVSFGSKPPSFAWIPLQKQVLITLLGRPRTTRPGNRGKAQTRVVSKRNLVETGTCPFRESVFSLAGIREICRAGRMKPWFGFYSETHVKYK